MEILVLVIPDIRYRYSMKLHPYFDISKETSLSLLLFPMVYTIALSIFTLVEVNILEDIVLFVDTNICR